MAAKRTQKPKARVKAVAGRKAAASLVPTNPRFFATQKAWRAWLTRHHARETVLGVGFWRVATGKPSITWPQLVDEALCFGWIDGLRHAHRLLPARARHSAGRQVDQGEAGRVATWEACRACRSGDAGRDRA